MLVSQRDDELMLVTQSDHGRVAGALAQDWGNDRFARCSLHEALVHTATFHDDGWMPLDAQPVWEANEQRPAHFLEVSPEVVIPAFRKGVDEIYDSFPLAGVLESMHLAGLYNCRWGLDATGKPVQHPLAVAAVEDEERRWIRAIREAWGHQGPRSSFEQQIWHGYEVLQTLDLLSLCLGLTDLRVADPDTKPVPMPPTLFSVHQPPGGRVIPSAPTGPDGEHLDLTVKVVAPFVVEVDPFPWAGREIVLEIPARHLEIKSYGSAEAVAKAYQAAPLSGIACTVRSAHG